MNRNRLILFLLFISAESFAQEKLSEELVIKKNLPVYVHMSPESLCKSYPLARHVSDSLKREGFKMLDSAGRMDILNSFFDHIFRYHERHNYKVSLEEASAYWRREQQSANLYQGILIENNSCLDTQHNYTITIYQSLRWKERARLSFTFPLDSPYSVTTVILSLITRPQ